MSFKKTKVVMLPTNEKAEIGFLTQKGKERGHLVHFDRPMPNILDSENQHLYFLSDEEIKEGDWYYDFHNQEVCQSTFNKLPIEFGNCKKIIATTDISLKIPQPSTSFIEKFVEEYNKGNVITEVLVEYEYDSYSTKTDGELTADFKLKINPRDNTITIRKVKDSWNRDEVIELAKRYAKRCQAPMTDSKWFEENL